MIICCFFSIHHNYSIHRLHSLQLRCINISNISHFSYNRINSLSLFKSWIYKSNFILYIDRCSFIVETIMISRSESNGTNGDDTTVLRSCDSCRSYPFNQHSYHSNMKKRGIHYKYYVLFTFTCFHCSIPYPKTMVLKCANAH